MKKKPMQITKGGRLANGLNREQEAFAQMYATSAEFFGNGVQSYIHVY